MTTRIIVVTHELADVELLPDEAEQADRVLQELTTRALRHRLGLPTEGGSQRPHGEIDQANPS